MNRNAYRNPPAVGLMSFRERLLEELVSAPGQVAAPMTSERARKPFRQRARGRGLGAIGVAMLAVVLAAGAALAGGVDLASVLPGYSVAQTPVVSPSEVAADLTPQEASTLNAMKAIGGVDISQLHRVRSTRLGVTVLIAPHIGGGVCTATIQQIATFTQCADVATLERGVMIKNDGGTIYVGLRPDGVTSVTDIEGNSVPVVDNVFISDNPIAP